MRRKSQVRPDAMVPPEVLEQVQRSMPPEKWKASTKCIVCGADTATSGSEQLCWVCRRLKISAWRDIEQQMPAQE